MGRFRKLSIFFLLSAASLGAAQSLGDFARQQRLAKNLPTASHHVITNEDISAGNRAESLPAASGTKKAARENSPVPATPDASSTAQLRDKIKAQKQKVLELQAHIQEIQKKLDARNNMGDVTASQPIRQLGSSRPGPCELSKEASYHPYQEWCDEPAKWKADLEKTKEKLQTEQAKLEALQEQARQLGFGNSFYDPD